MRIIIAEGQFKNVGYHYGDLGKGRDTFRKNMTGNRQTGHFGTGTYFLSWPVTLSNETVGKPMHEVDFSKYKLFRVLTKTEGFALHDGLRNINGMAHYDDYDDIRKTAGQLGIAGINVSEEWLKNFITKYIQSDDTDSASTVLMKRLGYDGIDVRRVDELDNFTYGSVIYDL